MRGNIKALDDQRDINLDDNKIEESDTITTELDEEFNQNISLDDLIVDAAIVSENIPTATDTEIEAEENGSTPQDLIQAETLESNETAEFQRNWSGCFRCRAHINSIDAGGSVDGSAPGTNSGGDGKLWHSEPAGAV